MTTWTTALAPHLARLDSTDKNWSAALDGHSSSWNVPLSDLSTPVFTMDVGHVAQNISSMHKWVAEHGALLAPHGKTTMSPGLWDWQLAEGAWGITVANEAQLRVARAAGVSRVIVANEFLSPQGLVWLGQELAADPAFDVTVWADSLEAVQIMSAGLTASSRRLGVCVELGAMNARTGARTREAAHAVAVAVVGSPHLELRGVSGYEGSVPGQTEEEKVENIRIFLAEMVSTFLELEPMFEVDEPILTAGGSAYFDLVVEAFSPVAQARVILRSGAYVVHDDGVYRRGTPAATRNGPLLQASVNVWARVISAPEPDLVLLDVGKRDVPYDSGLPEIQAVIREGAQVTLPESIEFTGTNDQHGYLRIAKPGDLRIGDIVKLGLSHPCTMFDKWRSVLLVEHEGDGPPHVRGAVRTFF